MATTADLFALQRQRALEQANAQGQQEDDAIKRRFAAQGGLNSGSYIKAQEVQSDNAMKRRQSALSDVDMAEAQDQEKKDEIAQQQKFQTSERLGSQDYGSNQAALQRAYGTSERLGGQDFQAGQAAQQRQFTTSERQGTQQFQSGMQQNQLQSQWDLQNRSLDVQQVIEAKKAQLQQQGIDLDKDAQDFNKGISISQIDDGQFKNLGLQYIQQYLQGKGGSIGAGAGAGSFIPSGNKGSGYSPKTIPGIPHESPTMPGKMLW